MNSEYASVGDQSGLFAGDGGYDIYTGSHTQLNGAVIASTADAANNRLSTGTLGWDSIDNHASYSASSASVGISGGYDGHAAAGQQFGGGAVPTLVNMSGSASGTTHSAVADGTITVRDAQHQTQDVAGLSHDTENANGSIDKIFDRDKVGNQMAFAQGVQELAGRVVSDVKTWQMDTAAKETAERLLKAHPDYANLSQDEFNARVQSDQGYKAVAEQWGTGGTWSMVATAVAGAVLAQISGNNAAAGAAGAAGGELAARAIVKVMYPDKEISDLTENQKQIVSSLSQLAAGLAGGIASDSSMGVGAGAGAGKNVVENNALANVLAAAEANKKGAIEKNLKAQKAVCEGNQAACTQMVKDVAGTGLDFVPIVGDIKGFVEAQTALDYLAAAIGVIPGAGDVAGKAIKAAETALKKGDVAEASRLINEGSQQI